MRTPEKENAPPTENDAGQGRDCATTEEVYAARDETAGPRPEPDAALDFLKNWDRKGPWVLTAIFVERKGIVTATFHPEGKEDLRAWLKKHERCNLYFHVNPVLRDLDKKAERTDVAALAWLHVDIDPRAGEDLQAERERALRLLRNPPGGVPPPTCIVFSGGGYQGFWKLKEPVPIDGDLEKAEAAKLYNLQLELLFNADKCHNVDRIMRLPGTVNWPNEVKRKKGREPALAELVEWHKDRTYPIEKFTPAPAVQSEHDLDAPRVKVTGNARRLKNVDDLPEAVPQRTKMLIVQGTDPDDPKRYPTRSHALFAVCCELVRAGVDDETIYAVITDPDFGISASVLDKGASIQRYAVKQIQDAREKAIHPWLRTMNEKHAVIGDMGGKCRVISEVWDHKLKRWRISKQSFEDVRNRYMNRQVDTGAKDKDGHPVMMPLGHWWLGHRNRRQFETIAFVPGQEIEGAYNLWKGFSCEPKEGDCQIILDHARDIVCAGDEGHYRYFMGWMARAVQHPDSPGYTAVILRGGQGTGKSIFAKMFGELWGRHFLQVTNPQHLVGHFNAHLRDCVVLLGDEAFYAGDKRHESILKMLITEEMLTVEAKGVDMEASANYIHLIMASNDRWVVPAGVDDRRIFVLDVSEDKKNDTAYFGELVGQYETGGKEAFLHYLQNYDLDGFEVRIPPKTKALQEQKELSLSPDDEWVLTLLEEATLPLSPDGQPDRAFSNDQLGEPALYGHARQAVPALRFASGHRLGRTLRSWGCEPWSDGKHRGWRFPPLLEMRRSWVERVGPRAWDSADLTEWRDALTLPGEKRQ